MQDIVKRFGSVHALKGFTFRVRPGEIQALVSKNGAGKSTLVKILSGAVNSGWKTLARAGSNSSRSRSERAKLSALPAWWEADGAEVSIEEAKVAARNTNFLALLEQYIGDLNRVESFVMLLVFVASSPDFMVIGGLECL